jgi:hypothetical protein
MGLAPETSFKNHGFKGGRLQDCKNILDQVLKEMKEERDAGKDDTAPPSPPPDDDVTPPDDDDDVTPPDDDDDVAAADDDDDVDDDDGPPGPPKDVPDEPKDDPRVGILVDRMKDKGWKAGKIKKLREAFKNMGRK